MKKEVVTIKHSIITESDRKEIPFKKFVADVCRVLHEIPDAQKDFAKFVVEGETYYESFNVELNVFIEYQRWETDEEFSDRTAAEEKYQQELKRSEDRAQKLKLKRERAQFERLKAKYG